ncbi:hypothetical protein OH76DRAFT_149352 [Lentinus brumalis]|uniref:Uncharacterized protein n=1 Tax=Lentinus brumalis TaxID=2498619 RepID=A0A371CP00_9APHY|nr:hypothetical protein OH76DRAFT_149352 [Polyporus brumalis]
MSESSQVGTTAPRIPRPVVVAGLEFPPERLWKWYLDLLGEPTDTPFDPSLDIHAANTIADVVRPKGLRFIAAGDETARFVLVTQSKWFKGGYRGMPNEEIPLYPPDEGHYEQRARRLLRERWAGIGLQIDADALPYVTFLTGQNPELY